MYILTAKGCAWRAIYVYSGKHGERGPLRFSIGIDPTKRSNRAALFGSIGYRRDCTGGHKGAWFWELPLWQAGYWWKLDGRRHTVGTRTKRVIRSKHGIAFYIPATRYTRQIDLIFGLQDKSNRFVFAGGIISADRQDDIAWAWRLFNKPVWYRGPSK